MSQKRNKFECRSMMQGQGRQHMKIQDIHRRTWQAWILSADGTEKCLWEPKRKRSEKWGVKRLGKGMKVKSGSWWNDEQGEREEITRKNKKQTEEVEIYWNKTREKEASKRGESKAVRVRGTESKGATQRSKQSKCDARVPATDGMGDMLPGHHVSAWLVKSLDYTIAYDATAQCSR